MKSLARILTLTAILALPFKAEAPQTTDQLWNEFALQARAWVEIRNNKVPGSYNVAEARQWKLLKDMWPKVRKAIDLEYEQ